MSPQPGTRPGLTRAARPGPLPTDEPPAPAPPPAAAPPHPPEPEPPVPAEDLAKKLDEPTEEGFYPTRRRPREIRVQLAARILVEDDELFERWYRWAGMRKQDALSEALRMWCAAQERKSKKGS